MTPRNPQQVRGLAARARVVVVVLLGVLVAVLFRFQVLRSSDWLLESQSNRLRPLTVPAPRGVIRDRAGRVFADNVPGYSVSIIHDQPDSMISTLHRLREHLEFDDRRFEELANRARTGPPRPLLVSVDAPFDVVAALQERRSIFPRLLIESRPKRRYPAGRVGAHVIGYVGEINEAEVEAREAEGAEPGWIVGRSGVEAQYESTLQGRSGMRYVEVDAAGRIVGSFEGVPGVAAEPGTDLQLNLDLELMEWIDRVFPEGMNGSVVALDVETGGVLALYSAPAFDPNVFAGVVDRSEWDRLVQDPESPLYHRAVMGKYPPGSPWKLATAAIALDLGVVTPSQQMPVSCRGSYVFGNRTYRCWKPEGHGSLDLAGAIQHSCNVYFYQLGVKIGLVRMLEVGNRMGFGEQCGIDLPTEARGDFPEGPEYWERRFNYRAQEGEALNLAIGQGPNSQTPLKMAQFVLAVARDGSAPAPSVLRSTTAGAAEASWSLNIPQEHLEQVREGMRRVTREGGTAYLSSLEHFDLLGKTGTAQSGGDRPSHAWFTAIAGPYGEAPEIVVVALVEFGESGSAVAAPLVAKTADFYLRGRHGVPRDTIQTLGEHLRAGRNTAWARPDR